jgi:MarR-like DNA-binding transcriptional regulator SgrR of sgrS sRNA
MKNWKLSERLAHLVLLATAISSGALANAAAEAKVTKESVRTYMNFAKEVDPAHILTMADLELSIALSTPLVVFNSERQVVSGLAETWAILPPNKVSFALRKNLRWSDGSKVTAAEYKSALERAKRLYANDLKALFEAVVSIDAPDEHTLIFETVGPASESGLLLKLTEPMYGLVAIKGDKLNLSKTVGPFYVKEKSEAQLTLEANKNWYAYTSAMPSVVEIRPPKEGADLTANFDKDAWPNLSSGSSLMSKEISDRFKKSGFKTWQRSLDKVFSLYPSKRFLGNDGANFIKELSHKIDCDSLLRGLSGYSAADQFFPRGYELFSNHPPKPSSVGKWNGKGPITVLFIDNVSLAGMREELVKLISKVSGRDVKMELIPLSKADERMKLGDFDIFGVQIAVADPNFEGAMSFFIERDPPFIQSGKGKMDFSTELRAARGLPTSIDRAERMREIMISAQESGHVLPLFHFSSLAIAKPGIDLSEIPNSDETILFSKVRIR